MRRVTLEPAYVLHGRPFRETSLIVETFTREFGRQAMVARGARGAKSRWRSILQPFRPLLMSWSQRGDLGTLTGADQVASTPPLSGESLLCGLYANEIMMRLLQRGDPHPDLFVGYRSLLANLSAGDALQKNLRLFERDLLQSLGFGLQLDHEYGSDTAISAEHLYLYQPDRGAVRAQHVADAGQNSRGYSRAANPSSHELNSGSHPTGSISGSSLLALKSGDIENTHLRELKALMRGLIRYHLGDRPLASHALFRK